MTKYIKNFQSNNGLVSDGIIGKKTLSKMMKLWDFTNIELAHLLGQMAHESSNFSIGYENLNYSEKSLKNTFPKYFKDPTLLKICARNPQRIANIVYANRMGNGNEASGDGWTYRGRGGIQLTGKDNYVAFSDFIGEDVVNNPDLVAEKYFFETGVFYFKQNIESKYMVEVNDYFINKVSRGVNLGNPNSKLIPNGLLDRKNKTNEWWLKLKKL